MQPHAVTHVNEISVTRIYPLYHIQRLFQAHVGYVTPLSQGIDDQQGDTLQAFHHVVGNGLGIGDVGQWTNPETIDRQSVVHDRNGFNPDPFDKERLIADDMFLELGNAGIRI